MSEREFIIELRKQLDSVTCGEGVTFNLSMIEELINKRVLTKNGEIRRKNAEIRIARKELEDGRG